MNPTTKHSPEIAERAGRLVSGHQTEHASRWAAIDSRAARMGCTAQTLHEPVPRVECRRGFVPGLAAMKVSDLCDRCSATSHARPSRWPRENCVGPAPAQRSHPRSVVTANATPVCARQRQLVEQLLEHPCLPQTSAETPTGLRIGPRILGMQALEQDERTTIPAPIFGTYVHCTKYGIFGPKPRLAQVHVSEGKPHVSMAFFSRHFRENGSDELSWSLSRFEPGAGFDSTGNVPSSAEPAPMKAEE